MQDSRSRSYTKGVHVSGLGGRDYMIINGHTVPRLEATPYYSVPFTVDAGDTEEQVVGILARGCWLHGTVNHAILSGGTLALELVDPQDKHPAIALGQTIDLSAEGFDAGGAFFTPLDYDTVLSAQVTGGTAGEIGLLSLDVGVLKPDWH